MTIGDLQNLTLLAVARLDEAAVSKRIRDELEQVAGRSVSVSTVFVTLTRLEDQGLLRSEKGPAPARGGRRMRIFRLTPDGWVAIREARAQSDRLWEGLETP